MTILMLYSTFGDERFGEYVFGAAYCKLELRELEKQAFSDLAKRTLQGQDRLSWLAYLQSKVHFYLPNLDELSEGCIHSAGKQDLLLHPA